MESVCAPRVRTALIEPEIALFLAALVPGLYYWVNPDNFGFGHGFEMAASAKNLVAQGVYGNPFEPALTGPTAELPPLYPLFLAALIRIFHEPLCGAAALMANILVNALIAAMMPRVSRLFFRDSLPGIYAGVLWILSMRLLPQWDTTFTVAALLLFVLCSRTVMRGVLAAALSLLNPVTMLICAGWLAFTRTRLRDAAVIAALVAACNAPWLIRNYGIWHTLVVRTNFGTTIYSSNNDCAEPSLLATGRNGCFQKTHLVASANEIALLQQLGEVEYDRRRTHDAFEWIRSHPARFRQLTLARIAQFWFPEPEQAPLTSYAIWVITLLSIAGAYLLWGSGSEVPRRLKPAPQLLFLVFVWLVYPLTYYIVVACDRYRYPILWTSLLPAGFALCELQRKLTRSVRYRPDPAD